ncbi:NUDIX hydrolase domain-like protein [Aspergillus floccosus]
MRQAGAMDNISCNTNTPQDMAVYRSSQHPTTPVLTKKQASNPSLDVIIMHSDKILTFADQFVISCGTISVDIPRQKVLLLHSHDRGIVVLPKGRKNRGENLESAAIRETTEETGYSCQLLPHTAPVKAPLDSHGQSEMTSSGPHTEPIAVQQWMYSDGVRKLIFWFIAVADSTETPSVPVEDGAMFEARWHSFGDAGQQLSFPEDRLMVEKAIGIVQAPGT